MPRCHPTSKEGVDSCQRRFKAWQRPWVVLADWHSGNEPAAPAAPLSLRPWAIGSLAGARRQCRPVALAAPRRTGRHCTRASASASHCRRRQGRFDRSRVAFHLEGRRGRSRMPGSGRRQEPGRGVRNPAGKEPWRTACSGPCPISISRDVSSLGLALISSSLRQR